MKPHTATQTKHSISLHFTSIFITEFLAMEADSETINALLGTAERDFLVRNNGDQVKIGSLKGKKIGLYFSASWCGPCRRFTPTLIDVYNEVSSKGDFEIIFCSADGDDESFNGYFSKMPWLAIPFSDKATRDHLNTVFKVKGIPHLVILGDNGKILNDSANGMVLEYGAEAYPFTKERVKELEEKEAAARREQSLRSLLVSDSRDFVVTAQGDEVAVSELEGKVVGLFFAVDSYATSAFTRKLEEVYGKLKDMGESFEIVLISFNEVEEWFMEMFENMPSTWFALPFKDKSCAKLSRYFEVSTFPTLVIIGPNGKTLHCNAVETVKEHGALAYPFTPERLAELAAMEKAKEEAQTLESLLISEDLDFVIGKNGAKIQVSDLVGKMILIYFSAHWCPPCRNFTPKLIEAYNKIKAKHDAFEIIFVSWDREEASFDEYFSGMPWLALPFGDKRESILSSKFRVSGIPKLVAIGSNGRTITREAVDLISIHGSDAYPFTDEHVKEIEAKFDVMANGWPEKVKHELHEEHELALTRCRVYGCDGCCQEGHIWCYYCAVCDFNLHPKCALGEEKESEDGAREGWVCDGEVCSKA